MSVRWTGIFLAACVALAQQTPPNQNDPEQQELLQALSDANSSPVDIIRILEAFLKEHPRTAHLKQIESALAKAAIDNKDDRRTVLYGERVLASTPDDVLALDRVSRSLLVLGGRENAAKALTYAQTFERIIGGLPPPQGHDAAGVQEGRDRALSRVLLYESRAKATLGDNEAAERLAAKSFSVYPSEEPARTWSEALARLGRGDDSVARLADAFAIPDTHATEADRAADRLRLSEQYRQLHGSEKGLGDLILAAYDRTTALLADRRNRLRALDPNFDASTPLQFTLTGLDGKKLSLASLQGSVVVLDFWATWCGPCRTQHPMYETVKQRFHDRSDVVFLSIDADEDRGLVAPFLDRQKWSHTVYFEDGLQRLLQVTAIPTTVLFDKRGRVASRMNGFLPDQFVDQLTERIRSTLAESSNQ